MRLGPFIRWLEQADAWLDENPDRRAAHNAWEAEFVDGSGEYGSHQWPGWADSPMGPWPT